MLYPFPYPEVHLSAEVSHLLVETRRVFLATLQLPKHFGDAFFCTSKDLAQVTGRRVKISSPYCLY